MADDGVPFQGGESPTLGHSEEESFQAKKIDIPIVAGLLSLFPHITPA